MKIPIEVLLDYMGYLNPEVRMEVKGLWIKSIQLLPKRGGLDGECLYFTDSIEAARQVNVPVALLPDSDPEELAGADGCIILKTYESLETVFNQVLGFQNLIRDWIHEVEMSVNANEGVQRLLDLSERVFCNPIVVFTPSIKTLYAAWNIEPPEWDKPYVDLYKLGYLSVESFNLLKKNGYFDESNYTGELIHLPPSELKNFDSIITAVLNDETVCFLIAINFSTNPLTPGLMELYKYFVGKIKGYLQPRAEDISYMGTQFDYLIIEIIEGRLSSPREIRARSFMCPEGYFDCFAMAAFEIEENNWMFLSHARQALDIALPGVKSIQYKNHVILYFSERGDKVKWQNLLKQFNQQLEEIGGYAGLSEAFSGPESVSMCYHQALTALHLGRQLRGVKISGDIIGERVTDSRLFPFEAYHCISAVKGGEKNLGVLERILEYDAENGTDYYNILYAYLSTERNFTKAAPYLHMHRNNVIYHIRRICHTFELDLENPGERLRLLMLYKLDDSLKASVV